MALLLTEEQDKRSVRTREVSFLYFLHRAIALLLWHTAAYFLYGHHGQEDYSRVLVADA